MIHPVSSSTQTQAAAQPKAAPQQAAQPQQPAKAKPPSPTDTVTLSAAKQITQELAETSAQTTKEAAGGDIQAKHLLAREAADHAPIK
jgi:outer membrane biosynthesis protein TonB